VFESSALRAFLYGEPRCERVAESWEAAGGRTVLRVHRVHLGEVCCLVPRKAGEVVAEGMLADVRQLPTVFGDRVSPALMRGAGRL